VPEPDVGLIFPKESGAAEIVGKQPSPGTDEEPLCLWDERDAWVEASFRRTVSLRDSNGRQAASAAGGNETEVAVGGFQVKPVRPACMTHEPVECLREPALNQNRPAI